MSATGIQTFDSTLQTTNIWLDDVMRGLQWEGNRQKAYHALRTVLHALRDRMPIDNVAHLAAQLPMLVRGFFYEGWTPSKTPVPEHSKNEFLVHVTEAFLFDVNAQSEDIARTVFGVLSRHISAGEIEKVKRVLPAGIRELWT